MAGEYTAGRSESVVSPSPPGAARVRDLVFPDWNIAGAAAASVVLRARVNGGGTIAGQTNNLGSLVSTGKLFFQGLDTVTMNNGGAAGAGGSFSFLNAANVMVRTTRPVNWALDDDWNVHRIVWIGAMSIAPTSVDDTGLQLINSATQADGIRRTPQKGFGFQYTSTGLSLIVNNGGGPVLTTLATNGVGGYQSSDFHSMELRIFQALPTADASLKVVLDDVVLANISWAGGTLPVPSGAVCGFFPALWNNSTGGGAVCTHYLGIQAGPTELATF